MYSKQARVLIDFDFSFPSKPILFPMNLILFPKQNSIYFPTFIQTPHLFRNLPGVGEFGSSGGRTCYSIHSTTVGTVHSGPFWPALGLTPPWPIMAI